MTEYTHLNDIRVQGSVESSTQGKMFGVSDTMPAPSSLNQGQTILYLGETGEYVKNTMYRSNGSAWVPLEKGLSTNDYTTTDKEKLEGIDLSGYATKGDLSSIPKFTVFVLPALPETGISETTIYLIPNSGSAPNAHDEYINVNGVWEKIGTTEVDLSAYARTEDVNTKLAEKQDTLSFDSAPTSGSNNPVTSGGVYTALQNTGVSWTVVQLTKDNFISRSWKVGDMLLGDLGTLSGTSGYTKESFSAYVSNLNLVCVSSGSTKISFRGTSLVNGNMVTSASAGTFHMYGLDYNRSYNSETSEYEWNPYMWLTNDAGDSMVGFSVSGFNISPTDRGIILGQ